MIVALSTGDRRAHPDGHRGVDAIDNRNVSKFLVVRSALVVGQCVAVESSRDELIFGWFRQQVASDLLDGELVEGLVRVE